MHVCYFGTYKPSYPRNRIVVDGLRANGVRVTECNAQLWGDTDERIELVSGGWRNLNFWIKALRQYIGLIKQELMVDDYDIMLVGYPGIFDIYLARLLTWRRGRPLVFDVLMSLHLIFEERNLNSKFPLLSHGIYWLEKGACKISDKLVLDTMSQCDYFCRKYGLSSDKFCIVPLGADNRSYYPLENETSPSKNCNVIYYGQFVPLHGVTYIIEAAHLLQDYQNIHFILVGEGTTKPEAESLVEHYGLENVIFTGWIDKSILGQYIGKADICLGVFGNSEQATYTVPNKIWEGLAMRKAVITGKTPAAAEVLRHGEHLYFCSLADGGSLAHSILYLSENRNFREDLASRGYNYYLQHFTFQETGKHFAQYLVEIVKDYQDR